MSAHCAFFIDGRWFALSAATVTEFGRVSQITPAPLSPPAVAGLINLRGQIVTVIDIRRYFGLQSGDPEKSIGIFFNHEEARFCLLVDAVDDIIELDHNEFEAPPGNLAAEVRDVLVAVCKQPQHLLMIIDPHRTIQAITPEASHP